ncbi:MAG TPA: FAD-dependent monooxygenase, partial [Chitinophagales bacterium]|nr:FAD-dependent monooxygenase [Chitinophagales bacterium]
MNEVITIIGAGIGGLTMGLILKQNGIPFQLFESATAIQPVGAGIIIANNAMQVYKKLAIHHKIETVGNKVNALSIT